MADDHGTTRAMVTIDYHGATAVIALGAVGGLQVERVLKVRDADSDWVDKIMQNNGEVPI